MQSTEEVWTFRRLPENLRSLALNKWVTGMGQRFIRISLTILGLLMVVGNARVGTAQVATNQSNGAYNHHNNDDRQRLYDQLAEEASEMEKLSRLTRRVARLVRPNVIHIEASKTDHKNRTTSHYDEAGSGVIFDFEDQYWVLTNRHVINGANKHEVKLQLSNGHELYPEKMISDRYTDIAVLRLGPSPFPLIPARIGDSDRIEIGDFVLAIGSPFGLSDSVTFGILSAKGRRDLTLGEDKEKVELQDFFQTDAAINPGNSGGPLLNLRGEVIGLNTAIASSSGGSEGIGFAIPINMAMLVAKRLIRNRRPDLDRAYLGVTLDEKFGPNEARRRGLSNAGGALIKHVSPGSPAQAAKLLSGDIILRFGDVSIDDDDHLVACVGLTEIGSEVSIEIHRGKKRYQAFVTVTGIPGSRRRASLMSTVPARTAKPSRLLTTMPRP